MTATESLAGWMIYAVCVSAFLGLVATAAEELVRRRGMPVRLLWGASLSLSLVLPLLMWGLGRGSVAEHPVVDAGDAATVHAPLSAAVLANVPAASDVGTLAPTESQPTIAARVLARLGVWRNAARVPDLARFDGVARIIALASPVACILWLVVAWMSLRARRRGWHEGTVDGTAVLLSADFGPAIVGVRHPRIVVPQWATNLTATERHLIIAHEREHLAAHDGRAVTAALCSLAIMPWNVALWPLVRRLRLAVELDCDARLLAATPDVRQYGTLLLEVARHAPSRSAMVAALVERPSALRRRIEAMTARGRASWARVTRDLSAVALAAMAAVMIAPPRAELTSAAPSAPAASGTTQIGQLSRRPERAPGRAITLVDSGTSSSAGDSIPDYHFAFDEAKRHASSSALPSPAADDIPHAVVSAPDSALVENAPVNATDRLSGPGSSDILRGVVTTQDGTPIGGAVASATDQHRVDAKGDPVEVRSRTNPSGRYTLFIANGSGDYLMRFSAEGYNDTTAVPVRGADGVLVADATLTKSVPVPSQSPLYVVDGHPLTPAGAPRTGPVAVEMGRGGGFYAPSPETVFIAPMPMPATLHGALVVDFFVNEQGGIDTLRFTPTLDSSYSVKLESTLRAIRFKPGQTADGKPVAAWFRLTYQFP